jgi:hypothetical protein
MLGFDGSLIGRGYIEEQAETQRRHKILRFDATGLVGRWEPETLPAGQLLREPKPLFLKLDESIADAEMARMAARV